MEDFNKKHETIVRKGWLISFFEQKNRRLGYFQVGF